MIYTIKMLQQKIEHESTIDMDWYCIDNSEHIAVVASGGGMLPNSVARQLRADEIIKYFRCLPVIANKIILEKRVTEEMKLMSTEQQKNYLKDVNLMVSKGLYYFDKRNLSAYSDFEYYLKAKPDVALKKDIIDDLVRSIISKTFININFDSNRFFHVNEVT